MTSKRLAVVDAVLKRFRIGLGYDSELGILEGDKSGYLTHQQPHITTATRLGDRFMAVDDSDTDDSTVNIAITDCRDILMKGSAINRWHVLPDATSLVAGTVVMVFRNWSSEIRGVRNSDSTLWLRIMPSQTAVVFLTEGGTAAGVWGAELSPIHPDYGFYDVDDFVGNSISYGTKLGFGLIASGTGATVTNGFHAIGNNAGWGMGPTTGTTTTGYAMLYAGTYPVILGAMAYAIELKRGRLADLSTAGEEYSCDFGFGDSTTDAECTDAVLFRYKRGTSVKWLRVKGDGGSVVETATDIDVAEDTNLNMRVEIASDASRADFWINRVHAGNETTGLPSGSDYTGIAFKIIKSAGTTARSFVADGIELAFSKPTRRS